MQQKIKFPISYISFNHKIKHISKKSMNLKRISKVYVSPSVSFFNFFDRTTQAYQAVFTLHKVSVPLKNDHIWKSIKCIWLCDTWLENPWEGDF